MMILTVLTMLKLCWMFLFYFIVTHICCVHSKWFNIVISKNLCKFVSDVNVENPRIVDCLAKYTTIAFGVKQFVFYSSGIWFYYLFCIFFCDLIGYIIFILLFLLLLFTIHIYCICVNNLGKLLCSSTNCVS